MPPAAGPGGGLLDAVRSIAVLRGNALGDHLMATPALHALRRAHPAASIVLVGARWDAAFLRDRPGPVDAVVVLPRVPGLAGPVAEVLEEARDLLGG